MFVVNSRDHTIENKRHQSSAAVDVRKLLLSKKLILPSLVMFSDCLSVFPWFRMSAGPSAKLDISKVGK